MTCAIQDGRDYDRICPLAECRDVGGRIYLSAPIIGVCAKVEQDESFIGWPYSVSCERHTRHVRGVKDDQTAAVSEMLFWLNSFGCPGRLSVRNG